MNGVNKIMREVGEKWINVDFKCGMNNVIKVCNVVDGKRIEKLGRMGIILIYIGIKYFLENF